MKNNKFWTSVIIFFLVSVLIILIVKPLSFFSLILWLSWRIFDFAKYPITFALSVLRDLAQLPLGNIGEVIADIAAFISGILFSPIKFWGEVMGQLGRGMYDEALAYVLSIYAVIGGLVWSIKAKKKGLTLILIGSIYGIGAVVSLIMALTNITSNDLGANLIITLVFVIIGASGLYIGMSEYQKHRIAIPLPEVSNADYNLQEKYNDKNKAC